MEAHARAYQNWLPASAYELAASFDFELYDERFHPSEPQNSLLELYLPVRLKG